MPRLFLLVNFATIKAKRFDYNVTVIWLPNFEMLRFSLTLLAISLTLAQVHGAVDYCNATLCGTSTNIGCNNNGTWSTNCPTSPAPYLIAMNLTMRQHLVKLHNVRRNNIALGNLPRYDTAKRMATMRWSPQLATLAALNVKQCQMKHDACHNTPKYKMSGQNLAFISYSGASSSQTNAALLTSSVTMWWNERLDANKSVIAKYPSDWTGPEIGHFTVMARQNNVALGCAAARYVTSGMNNFLLACNYATTNIVGNAVYVAGTTAAGCTTGTNVNYPGLCKVAEVFTY
ncbi:antigen 5 like allergen Cul n 1-like [Drosophila sulfurigaster albostrigata]|uniref:antigen 5 like allergen Cul n 1-like n=1 Tax=Drosophila sulfurigaster albostrigata TaxID=89887 RepID=UPI002D21E90A|nr:antigen 5 like allergen Cul n 1-like [Drosophila sulfurigaster albostrigata]